MSEQQESNQWEGELYRLLAENIKDYAIFILDGTGRVESWTKAAQDILGYREEEILGQHFSCFFLPEDIRTGEPEREMEQAVRSGRGEDDRWHRRKDGTQFWSNGVMTPLRDERGELRGFAKIMRDLTEQKLNQEFRQEAEERFQFLVEAVQDYAIIMLDPEGRVTSWNTGAQKITQYGVQEILGQHASVFYTEEDRQQGRPEADLEEAARLGRSEDVTWRQGKHGSRFIAEVTLYSLKTAAGRLRGFVKVARDVTEQKRMQSALEEQARLLDRANVLARTLDGGIIFWNKGCEEMYGYGKKEALGAVSHRLLHTRFPKPLAEIEADLLRDGEWLGELKNVHKDGTVLRVWSRWLLHRGEAGNNDAVVEVTNDISERKQLEQTLQERTRQLERASKVRNHFLALISHEMRTPLSTIHMNAQLLERYQEGALPDSLKAQIGRMGRAAQQLSALIEGLLEYSQVESGTIDTQLEMVDTLALAREVVASVQREIAAPEVELVIAPVREDLPPFETDPRLLRLILDNLLSNALKFTHEGTVTLRLDSNEEGRIFEVRDTGIGIPQTDLPKIFLPFEQLEPIHRKSRPGVGLGLPLVKEIVDTLGGKIEVLSEAGVGSTFRVVLAH